MNPEHVLLLLASAAVSFMLGRLFGMRELAHEIERRQAELSPLERILGEDDED